MKVKLRSLFPKRRGKQKASSSTKGGSKVLDGVTVGVVEPSPTADTLPDTDEDDAVSPVDTSIETTLDSLPDLPLTHKLRLGIERTVVFHSPHLGVRLARGTDGHVRVQSLTPTANAPSGGTADPTLQGTIRTGDVVLEMAGTDLRRPIDAAAWGRAVAKVKRGTARPVAFVVAEERTGRSHQYDAKRAKTARTVPALEIEVDLPAAAGAASASAMDLRTSGTWEMEQSKAEWVEAEKRRQLAEEKARLLGMGTAEANNDSIEMGVGELRRMLDGAAGAVADMFSGVATGVQQSQEQEQELVEEKKKEEAVGGGRLSNPIDLDEVPSDLSSIAANNSVDNDQAKAAPSTTEEEEEEKEEAEERLIASAKAEAARAALWKQAANKNDFIGSCGGGQADDNDRDGAGGADGDADIVQLNRINTAMFERIDAKQTQQQQQLQQQHRVVARKTTGGSAGTGLTTSGGDGASAADGSRVVREQSLTGSYTDVSENFMMESFLFLNREVQHGNDDDDDEDDNDVGGGEKKEDMQSTGRPMANADKNNEDGGIAGTEDGDFFTEEDDYIGNCKITCDEHMINRIDDIVCSSAVCSALPEQFLGGGGDDDDDDDDDDDLEEDAHQGDLY